jgi:ribosomal protein S18 acetylase RimI-like enzyme
MRIREAIPNDAFGIAKVKVDTWRTTYPGIVPDEILSGLSYESSERNWRTKLENLDRVRFSYVAEDDDGALIGFVAGGTIRDEIEGYDGEIYAIYVLQDYQGKGLGRSLMSKAAQRLKSEGITSMMLWVLADNPTRHFYEALNGILIAEKEIEIGGTLLPSVGYGWQTLEIFNGPDEP